MKRTLLVILVLSALSVLCSCQGISEIKGTLSGLKDRISGETAATYQSVAPETLPEISQKAVDAFEMAKRGTLESSPYVKVAPQGKKLENTTDYREFIRRNTIIMDFTSDPDGTYVQDMLSESVDRFGRIDVSHERIAYSLREPTENEAAVIAESMIDVSKSAKYMDSPSRRRFSKSVADFQRTHGLTADGVMGRNTAKTAARETSVLDIKEMTSRIVLPEKPRTLLFAVPYEVVKQDPAAFTKGFDSLDAVKQHALTREKFQEIDQPGRKFTVFLYFLDRIDPAKAVRVGLASSGYRWSEVITPIAYAPEEWPVLVDSFQIDEKMGDTELYANVFQKTSFAYTCIGSYRLK